MRNQKEKEEVQSVDYKAEILKLIESVEEQWILFQTYRFLKAII